ncbi:MAG: ferritin-like domain-containing protein [Rhodospirillaceae bacterium]|jgi:uncharacterized ferritin-like protein (DUF455 family)|nr:ferritin-like domain-containing protein [Rhodospirillaceae bacterium]MBT3883702.1 ferritin-like domain-containing protein [Rhodospirillaceae bacterium]MBT4119136.1 ferritin-like domain-containing protein [Rhodospirillaceae bacterium]MBT4674666.1 ferritin-like domain-containing protein [Rhodospirillaceae bacterium]MBT4749741.1 ferritin-like domain-containing protein [Rhodospirillaceae bacterium]
MAAFLSEAACEVLNAADPAEKVRLSALYASQWAAGTLSEIGAACPPERPARPERPQLCRPGDMKRRRFGSAEGRVAFIHAIAHIELNAIDLAWDMVARFTHEELPAQFYAEWVGVAADEARHFQLLADYLERAGAAYGDLPAHDGLWEAALETSDDILARLALVPLVLEARGLDTTPAAISKLTENGDTDAAAILAEIAAEEIPHVAAGVRWFEHICEVRGLEPKSSYQDLVRARFKGNLKAPFATEARAAAGFDAAWYEPLAI